MLTELVSRLLPDATVVRIDSFDGDADRIILTLTMVTATVFCPQCRQPASKVHSRYVRTLADLPWAALAIQLRLRVRKFFCHNPACPRRIFAEQPPSLVVPFARRTNRLRLEQQQLALAHGGEAGAWTARRLKMPLSPDTLLRLARRTVLPLPPAPQIIGVDEWSCRRGRSYGTIVVDLERHRAIDLLPDRSAESFATWLKDHPGILVISRDRAGTYADGARRGAPAATQVADRFHLIQNLRETVERLLARHQQALHAVTRPPRTDTAGTPTEALAELETNNPAPQSMTRAEQRQQQRRDQRYARYEQVIALRNAGDGIRAIASKLGCSRYLVRRYLAADQFPETAQRRKRPSQIDPFVPYLTAQLAAGQDNAAELYRAIQAQGFGGSASRLRQWVSRHHDPHLPPRARPRRGSPPNVPAGPQQRPLSARGGSWLLVRERQKLTADEQVLLERLLTADAQITAGYTLAQSFGVMVRERGGANFDQWLAEAEESGLIDFRRFAASLRQDYAAVEAGLTLAWNSGQVEGQVNKLKLIKRMGYGRAKFDLLKQRVLAA
jgi:transposase